MLKAHQACIDLEKGVLRIQGREVKFLAEHELPDKARLDTSAELEGSNTDPNAGPSTSAPAQPASSSHTPAPQFPGGGSTLGAPPSSAPGRTPIRSPAPAPPQAQPSFPEASIEALAGFGATREQAIQLLQAAGGNLDIAASLLFQ
ncbi:hypothetical protein BDV93DRAFT_163719 [Ceratobasidium sp. AG-I]|nr:hypothetical protein BDV93DRAFT_163719 [Ceratobasidium sp. AG-I]